MTIAAPAQLMYDGTSRDAECTYTDWVPAQADITYNDVDRVNVTGGEITASLTYGDVTVSVSYQITPREITGSMVTVSPSSSAYNGTEKKATATAWAPRMPIPLCPPIRTASSPRT